MLCLSMFVSTEDGDREDVVATAIVWDYTDNEVYILTNYHTWDDEEFRYCFPPPNETKPQKGKRKVTDAGTKSKKKGKNNSEMDDTNDDEEKVDPIKLKLYNEYDFSYTFVLSSDMFHRWEKDEDFAVLKLPKSQFTLPRIPICLEISITMKIHAFGYIGHTKVFNVTGGDVASLIPEGFTMNLLSAEGFSGAAILADGLGRAVGYMGGNLDASKKSNSQHQSYAFTFDRVAMVTERNITPKNSPAAKRTMGVK